jgi:cytochrome b
MLREKESAPVSSQIAGMEDNRITTLQKHLDKKHDAFQAFFIQIVAVSTSALGLSITFMHEITGSHPTALWLLKVSWACFAIAVVLGTLYRYDDVMQHDQIVKHLVNERQGVAVSKSRLVFRIAYKLTVVSFVAGVVFLVGFAMSNVGK